MKKLKNNILFQSCNLTKIIDSKTKKINYGIELLRFLLCFWIVVYHCSYIKPEHKKILTRTFHVPTFFLMAFYFYFPYFSKRKISKIISRFERLLIPYVIWPILILIMNNYLMEIISFAKIKKKRNITFKEFYIQILVADSYHPIFFFQFNLIIYSLLFTIISFLTKKYLLEILSFLGVISIYINLSGLNYIFFINKKFKLTLGTLIELIPLTILGCIYCYINIITRAKCYSIYYRIILFFLIYLLFKFDIVIKPVGFRYPNVILNLIASTLLFVFFGSLSINNFVIRTILNAITKNTGGIYYTHLIIRDYFQQYIPFLATKTYFSSSLIYLLCFIICFFGSKLFKNNHIKKSFLKIWEYDFSIQFVYFDKIIIK